MKIRIGESAAASLILPAVIMRIFYGIAIDMPAVGNAGWLSALLGGVLALPFMLAVRQMRARCAPSPTAASSAIPLARPLLAVFALTAAFDAAFITNAIAGSASYIALNAISLLYLLLPQLALCLWCLTRGGDAIGTSAGVWNRILPWLMLIVVLLQLPDYRPAWLTPVLGPGLPEILDGAIHTAGWLSLSAGLLLAAEREENTKSTRLCPLKTLLLCTGIAAVLLVLRGLMTPTLMEEALTTRYFRQDMLISNGRAPLSLQLPLTILWFMSLFYLLLFDSLTCALMLQHLFPRLKRLPCLLLAVGGTIGIIVSGMASRETGQLVSRWLFAVQGGTAALWMLLQYRKGGVAHA